MSNAGDKPVVTQRARDELAALGYSVVDAHNDIVESGWLMRPPCITDRAWIAATEDDAWAAAARHREQDTLSREEREAPWPGCFADLQRRRVTTLAKLGLMLSIMAGGEAAEVVGYDAADLYAEVLMALAIEDADDTDIALEEARDHPDGDILAALSPPASEGRDEGREAVRDAIHDALVSAYQQGAEDVHNHWIALDLEGGLSDDPDFKEAAHDHAASEMPGLGAIIGALTFAPEAALSTPPAPEQPDMVGELVEAAQNLVNTACASGAWSLESELAALKAALTKYRSGDA